MGFLYLLICLAVWKADGKGDKANDLCKFVSKIMSRTILTPSKEINGSERADFSLNRQSAASGACFVTASCWTRARVRSARPNQWILIRSNIFPTRLTVHLLFHAHLPHLSARHQRRLRFAHEITFFADIVDGFCVFDNFCGAKRLKFMRRQTRVNDWGWKKWIKA